VITEDDKKEVAGLVAAIQDRHGLGPNGKVDVLEVEIERNRRAVKEGRQSLFLKPSRIAAEQHDT
jgi:hypothetical protein